MTKKRDSHILREKEKRDSRIKETRNFIFKNTSSSLLNNQKWYLIFEWIEKNNSDFELKTLLSSDFRKSKNILELENNSLLIDNSGDFIDFLELETLILKNSKNIKSELDRLNVEFVELPNQIEINGYRK